MSTLDWVMAGIVLLSALLGMWRGFVAEVMSVLGWVAAFVVAPLYAGQVAPHLERLGLSDWARYGLAWVLLFVTTLIVVGLLGRLVRLLLRAVGLRPIDRILGGAFGLLRGFFILVLVAVVVNLTPLKNGSLWVGSHTGQMLDMAIQVAKPVLPASFGQYLPQGS